MAGRRVPGRRPFLIRFMNDFRKLHCKFPLYVCDDLLDVRMDARQNFDGGRGQPAAALAFGIAPDGGNGAHPSRKPHTYLADKFEEAVSHLRKEDVWRYAAGQAVQHRRRQLEVWASGGCLRGLGPA